MPLASSSSSEYFTCFLQNSQIRRTRRCARMQFSDDTKLYASTPMFRKRPNHVDHVVGVHRGEHQVAGERGVDGNLRRFGVADFAHHDLVGIVTQNRTQVRGRRSGPSFSFTGICVMPRIWYSTGSSIVISLSSSLLISFNAA